MSVQLLLDILRDARDEGLWEEQARIVAELDIDAAYVGLQCSHRESRDIEVDGSWCDSRCRDTATTTSLSDLIYSQVIEPALTPYAAHETAFTTWRVPTHALEDTLGGLLSADLGAHVTVESLRDPMRRSTALMATCMRCKQHLAPPGGAFTVADAAIEDAANPARILFGAFSTFVRRHLCGCLWNTRLRGESYSWAAVDEQSDAHAGVAACLDPGMEIGPDRLVMWCATHGEAFGLDGGCRGCLAEIEELVPIEPSPHPGGSESE